MPLSTSLPAQPIVFDADFHYPTTGEGQREGTFGDPQNIATDSPASTETPNNQIAGLASTNPAGTVFVFEQLGGRTCVLATSTVGNQAQGFRPLVWMAGYDAAAFNPGAFYDPQSVVASIDFHVALTSSLFPGGATADVGGFWFQPFFGEFVQPNVADASPGGAGPIGGFGVAFNDDGGGNSQWEFISYDGVPNVLQRTVIGSAIIPDVTEWTTFRFTIIAAASGRAATMSLKVNGFDIVGVQDVPFDDVTLFRPNTLEALACGFLIGQCISPMATDGYRFAMYGRFGRFTTTGAELQAI